MKIGILISGDIERSGCPLKWLYIDRKRSFPDFSNSLLEQIQQFLGHTRLETTQIYAASTAAMIKESYQKALGR